MSRNRDSFKVPHEIASIPEQVAKQIAKGTDPAELGASHLYRFSLWLLKVIEVAVKRQEEEDRENGILNDDYFDERGSE